MSRRGAPKNRLAPGDATCAEHFIQASRDQSGEIFLTRVRELRLRAFKYTLGSMGPRPRQKDVRASDSRTRRISASPLRSANQSAGNPPRESPVIYWGSAHKRRIAPYGFRFLIIDLRNTGEASRAIGIDPRRRNCPCRTNLCRRDPQSGSRRDGRQVESGNVRPLAHVKKSQVVEIKGGPPPRGPISLYAVADTHTRTPFSAVSDTHARPPVDFPYCFRRTPLVDSLGCLRRTPPHPAHGLAEWCDK